MYGTEIFVGILRSLQRNKLFDFSTFCHDGKRNCNLGISYYSGADRSLVPTLTQEGVRPCDQTTKAWDRKKKPWSLFKTTYTVFFITLTCKLYLQIIVIAADSQMLSDKSYWNLKTTVDTSNFWNTPRILFHRHIQWYIDRYWLG